MFEAKSQVFFNDLLDAPVVQVDEGEKDRVLEGMKREFGASAPFTGESWEQFYEFWPDRLPSYVDLALSPDSIAYAHRPIGDGRMMLDVFQYRQGYLGSREPLGDTAPLAFGDGCVLVTRTEIAEDGNPNSSFHGLVRYCPEDTLPSVGAEPSRP